MCIRDSRGTEAPAKPSDRRRCTRTGHRHKHRRRPGHRHHPQQKHRRVTFPCLLCSRQCVQGNRVHTHTIGRSA
eukprot:619728-Alexandrium_andersonii.AAC.1